MRKTIFCAMVAAVMLTGCQESLEQRAVREAQEYTQKHCPEKQDEFSILDSITFDIATHTLTQHITLIGGADSPEKIADRRDMLHEIMVEAIRNDTNYKKFKDAGYSFRFIARGEHRKDTVLYDQTITAEDYR